MTKTTAESPPADKDAGRKSALQQQSPGETKPRSAGAAGKSSSSSSAETSANKAVSLQVVSSKDSDELSGISAAPGAAFLVLDTRWENIHPKQKVSKDALEGRADRTMGVGGLGAGGGSSKPVEYVEMDVAYKVPRLNDNIYVLADGQAIPLHAQTASLPGGADPGAGLTIAKLGETKDLQLAFLVPEDADHVALQLFDYSNGHLLIPLKGDIQLAKRSDSKRADVLDQVKTDLVELAAQRLDFADTYNGKAAGDGWRFAVVQLGGQSVSEGGGMGRILQFDPTKYMWVSADGGYLYYASAGSTDAKGNIRFTPEVYQQQEVAFRVPDTIDRLSMGLRINRDVVTLALTRQAPRPMPDARARHEDGDVMEVLMHGSRQDGDYLVLDLGIKPIVKGQGLEVRTTQQFLLQTPAGELRPDATATAALAGHPPDPFVVPPGAEVRFELAYKPAEPPTALRVRGFRSEGKFDL